MIETRLVHDMHRRATSILAQAALDTSVAAAAVDQLRSFLLAMLHHHHDSEDQHLWPMITADRFMAVTTELGDLVLGPPGTVPADLAQPER